jgi:2,4-dienoyl-CoA reductase-like NADH-dependent reductase (Old Yellow Enzyme family)
MKALFDPTAIASMNLPNRFMRSATWAGMATDEGAVTEGLTALMGRLAEGRVGLVMSGHAYVVKWGQAGPWQLGIHDDKLIDGLRTMTGAVHEHGMRIGAQLAHAGVQGTEKLLGRQARGPSAMQNTHGEQAEAMSEDEIHEVVRAFGRAASRAVEAGFDCVQIHAAHGYLASEFLSPYFNRRDDEYGGSLENRARFVLEVLGAVREAVGPHYPVLAKMNCRDFLEPEFTPGEMREVSSMLADAGLDALEMSGGTAFSGAEIPVRKGRAARSEEAWYLEHAREFRKECDLPLALVGGIRTYGTAENLVERGDCDFVSLSRPLIREPRLVKRWESGNLDPATCISCNMCFKGVLRGDGLYCLVEAGEIEEKEAREEE